MAVEHHRVIVIGAGFAGVGLGVRLLEQGIEDFLICERDPSVGGTWFSHTYPGCGCDVPTHLYSYSFAPNPGWSRVYPRQAEILDYVRRIADERGVMPHVRLGCEVERCVWNEAETRWRVRTSTGELTCDVLVSAAGATAEPADPDIPGLEGFAGHRFHSARWDHDHDLTGERVAVIGTGPAAAQFVPEIQPGVGHLTVFQRTPSWVLPRLDHALAPGEQLLYRLLPPAQHVRRGLTFATYELVGVGMRGQTRLIERIERVGRVHLARQVADRELRAKLTPHYRFGCKRPIRSDDFYPALTRPNASVVTEPIAAVAGNLVVTADGTRHEVDTIISATGYRYSRSRLADRYIGAHGRSLGEVWNRSPRAYLGTTVPGFPNLFILLGPNSISINSALVPIEGQIAYVLDALRTMTRRRVPRVEVRPEAFARWVDECDRRTAGSVWTDGGCHPYYVDEHGRNVGIYPGLAIQYRRRTRRFDPRAYTLTEEKEIDGHRSST